jgi:hypothetical protein
MGRNNMEAVRCNRNVALFTRSCEGQGGSTAALKDPLDALEYRNEALANLTDDDNQSEGDSARNKSILNGSDAVVKIDKAKELAHPYS